VASSIRCDVGDTWFVFMESEEDAKETLVRYSMSFILCVCGWLFCGCFVCVCMFMSVCLYAFYTVCLCVVVLWVFCVCVCVCICLCLYVFYTVCLCVFVCFVCVCVFFTVTLSYVCLPSFYLTSPLHPLHIYRSS
jgi:hypothetical protein